MTFSICLRNIVNLPFCAYIIHALQLHRTFFTWTVGAIKNIAALGNFVQIWLFFFPRFWNAADVGQEKKYIFQLSKVPKILKGKLGREEGVGAAKRENSASNQKQLSHSANQRYLNSLYHEQGPHIPMVGKTPHRALWRIFFFAIHSLSIIIVSRFVWEVRALECCSMPSL